MTDATRAQKPFARWMLIALLLSTFTLSACGGGGEEADDDNEAQSGQVEQESAESEAEDEGDD